MIINVRGANGSGKSTVARRVLDLYRENGTATPTMRPSRGNREPRPLYYTCQHPRLSELVILGTYENPTGGCDTIPDVETVFTLATTLHDGGVDVLFEGILAQHSSTRLINLARNRELRAIVLTTPMQDCVAAVKDRRAARGDERPFDPTNVEREFQSVLSMTRRIVNAGVKVEKLDREAAFARCVELLTIEDAACAG
jgi:hypothetical protein